MNVIKQMSLPPDILKNYVRFFWMVECEGFKDGEDALRVFARRFPRMIFIHTNGNSAIRKQDHIYPTSFVSGINLEPFNCQINANFTLTGVSFYSHSMHSIFGIDAHELKEEQPDLVNFAPADFTVNNAYNFEDKVLIIIQFLIDRLMKSKTDDTFIRHCLNYMNFENKETSVYALQKDFKLSERQLERKFKATIGLPPQQFLRISRFEKALELIQNKQNTNLTDIAFELNYTDQSHFIKEFKQFTGYSPKQFLNQKKVVEQSSSLLIRSDRN
jgi:AraC-like DNA-binding protein